ncbi:MAG: hypothetical protein ABI867_17830 [Kofleriaceae bacterium]
MATRWLVTLAMFVVSMPAGAASFRIEQASQRTTTTTASLARNARLASRSSLAIGGHVVRTREQTVRDHGGGAIRIDHTNLLDVTDAHTGKTLATTAIANAGILQALWSVGDTFVKTRGDLVAIARTGRIRWQHPTTAQGSIAVTHDAVIDGWVDRVTKRFGIAAFDPISGRRLASIELGSTHGWDDLERIHVAPDGPGEVVVSAIFGVR